MEEILRVDLDQHCFEAAGTVWSEDTVCYSQAVKDVGRVVCKRRQGHCGKEIRNIEAGIKTS